MSHAPVMLQDVLDALCPKEGGIYVDGTFGAGGYTQAILDAAPCRVIAIDRDESVRPHVDRLQAAYQDRFVFIHGAFGDVEALLRAHGFDQVDGFVLDIGVSSMQLDEAARGFSFRHDAALDMRMDRSGGVTAADIVNQREEADLADLIYRYGEERQSRRIAKKIVSVRGEAPIETTGQLAEIVQSVLPKTSKLDPATRTFQALRIAVNDELGQLEAALASSSAILKPAGRLVVVTFHSLEDRIVKRFLDDASGHQDNGSRYLPPTQSDVEVVFDVSSRKAVKPCAQEVAENARARSAKLRMGVRR